MEKNMKYVRKIIDNYCVLDLETTGLSPNYDSIIEIGIIKVKENKIVDKYNSLINPGFLINEYITSITGITNEMLKGKPKIIDLKKEVLNFIGNDVLVGHNISFDVSFLQKGFNEELKNEYIDTLQFCRKLFKELSHHRLTDMSNYLEISRNEHRSMSDCLCTKELYDCIKEKMKNNGLEINDIFAKKNYSSKNIDIHAIKPDNIEIDEDNFFYNKHCVFTGKLEKMIRKDAMQLVVNVGGILDNSVTKKTNYLILGNNDYCSSIKDGKSSKHKKAEKYKLEGQDIEIIDEDTFYNLFNLN
ncbi:exonuclease [Coprobacillus sp. AF31-1BH]|jgi:DNA polymerase-3 subunit epsilon|nr:exonuclease [Coprobacillus sp. AF31-1BH]RHR86800.1 exonuclease [Coprobacillus sp. AF15-30]